MMRDPIWRRLAEARFGCADHSVVGRTSTFASGHRYDREGQLDRYRVQTRFVVRFDGKGWGVYDFKHGTWLFSSSAVSSKKRAHELRDYAERRFGILDPTESERLFSSGRHDGPNE